MHSVQVLAEPRATSCRSQFKNSCTSPRVLCEIVHFTYFCIELVFFVLVIYLSAVFFLSFLTRCMCFIAFSPPYVMPAPGRPVRYLNEYIKWSSQLSTQKFKIPRVVISSDIFAVPKKFCQHVCFGTFFTRNRISRSGDISLAQTVHNPSSITVLFLAVLAIVVLGRDTSHYVGYT